MLPQPAIDEDCLRLRYAADVLAAAPLEAKAFSGGRIAWLMGADGSPLNWWNPEKVDCRIPRNHSNSTGFEGLDPVVPTRSVGGI